MTGAVTSTDFPIWPTTGALQSSTEMIGRAFARAESPEGDTAVGLRLDRQVARCGWRRQTTYRAATLAGMFTNSVFEAFDLARPVS